MNKKLILSIMIIPVVIGLYGCNENKEFYLEKEENKEILNNEFGLNNWEIIESEEVRNGFENPYYKWKLQYKNNENDDVVINLSSKNAYGLRQNFDKHLTSIYKKEHNKVFDEKNYDIDIISVQQTTSYDENEYLKKYKSMYSFNKELDWNNLLRKHHYIRVEMKSVNSNQEDVYEIKNYLSQYDNVEFIYFEGNVKFKYLKMHGKLIDERLLSNKYGDYRGYFLKYEFKY